MLTKDDSPMAKTLRGVPMTGEHVVNAAYSGSMMPVRLRYVQDVLDLLTTLDLDHTMPKEVPLPPINSQNHYHS